MTQPDQTLGNAIPPNRVQDEALNLSAEILGDIELSRADLSIVILKILRLARLLNDYDEEKVFRWESSGYPYQGSKATSEVWSAAERAGRIYYQKAKDGESHERVMYAQSIDALGNMLETQKMRIGAADGASERAIAANEITRISQRIAHRRTYIYDYASRKHYELKFSNLVGDIFGRVRASVDSSIGDAIPDGVRKLSSVSDNLVSDNPEDWANAAHSCRRLLQDLADAVFPPQEETRTRQTDGKSKEIKLGPDHYINRIVAFIEDSSDSGSYNAVVGSNLAFMGDRLDAIFSSTQKGSHSSITRREAERCVAYTYLLIGDILSLQGDSTSKEPISLGTAEEEIATSQEIEFQA
ncbi:MAG: hypothetical protein OXD31_13800 [Chloroflexi bacterium]|nr:hypothetical protein [Chloroflexota bacterium]